MSKFTVVMSPAQYEALIASKRMKRSFWWLLTLRVLINDTRSPTGWLINKCHLLRLDLTEDAMAAQYAANRADRASGMQGPSWLRYLPNRCGYYCQWATGRAFAWLPKGVPDHYRQRFDRRDA